MKNFRKQWTLILPIILALACQSPAPTNDPAVNTTDLVFVDKSPSTSSDVKAIIEKNEIALKRMVHEDIRRSGDQVMVSYIFQNTTAIGNQQVLVFDPPVNDKENPDSDLDRKQAEIRMLNEQQMYRTAYLQRVLQAANKVGHEGQGTFVLGSLPIIAEWTAKNPTERIKLLFLSDMIEWSPQIREMKFTGEDGITSMAKAQQTAKEDLEKVKTQLQVPADALANVDEITVVIPRDGLQEQAFSYLGAYWDTIFTGLGGPKASYH